MGYSCGDLLPGRRPWHGGRRRIHCPPCHPHKLKGERSLDLPFAEDINYWKTGRSAPDIWIERAVRQIEALGGEVVSEAFGRDGDGRGAFMLAFKLNGDGFKVVWPVLPSKRGEEKAARVQAATLLYHDVKAKAITASVLGSRVAFFAHLALPDGRTASEVATPELTNAIPLLLQGPERGTNR